MEPGDLLGAKIMWKRRYPRPFEIVCCDRGQLPLPGTKPYKTYCDIPDCKQGLRVAANGQNEVEDAAKKSSLESPEKPKEGLMQEDEKSVSVESPMKRPEGEEQPNAEEKNEVGWKVEGRCV